MRITDDMRVFVRRAVGFGECNGEGRAALGGSGSCPAG